MFPIECSQQFKTLSAKGRILGGGGGGILLKDLERKRIALI